MHSQIAKRQVAKLITCTCRVSALHVYLTPLDLGVTRHVLLNLNNINYYSTHQDISSHIGFWYHLFIQYVIVNKIICVIITL